MSAITIIGISGTLRKGSFNASLLRAALELCPPEATIDIQTIRGIPLYDGDVETAEGIPARATEIKDKIAAAAGLLLVCPEHNNSIPGVFKNAIDWLSRPVADVPRVFAGCPVGIIGTSPSPNGSLLGQTALLPVIRTLNMLPWFGQSMYIGGARQRFDAAGKLTDEETRKRLAEYMQGFVKFVATNRRS